MTILKNLEREVLKMRKKIKKLIEDINVILGEEKIFLHYSLAYGGYKVKIRYKFGEKDLCPLGTKREVYYFLLGIFQALEELKREE